MKKYIFICLLLAGCSNSQLSQINTALDQYDQAINNFNAAASRISSSIALTSQSLAGYCSDAKTVGVNLTGIVRSNSKALSALNSITAGLNTYCAAPPQDVGSAIVSLTAIIAAARQS